MGDKRKIEEYDEFEYNGYTVSCDLGSAWYDGGRIHIEGSATKDGEKRDVTVTVVPEDSPGFNQDISTMDDELTSSMIERYEAELDGVEDVRKKEAL